LNALRFQSDSIDYAPSNQSPIPIPKATVVNVVFGEDDTSNAVPQGETFWQGVRPLPTQACVPGAPHAVPSVQAGVTQIVNDITTMCQ
jgi:hypothetical protein